MVEGARLESVYTSKGYRGFESLSLRSIFQLKMQSVVKSIISMLCFFISVMKLFSRITPFKINNPDIVAIINPFVTE